MHGNIVCLYFLREKSGADPDPMYIVSRYCSLFVGLLDLRQADIYFTLLSHILPFYKYIHI